MAAEDLFRATSIGPVTAPTLRRLAGLSPTALAVMHGSSYAGNAAAALNELADGYERRLHTAMA